MKVKGIKLSEVIKSLEVLRDLCSIHDSCTKCWLYDPDEKETACFLIKTKEDSLSGNIEVAMEHIAQEHSCIMPECPYCPVCGYGHIHYPEDAMPGEEGLLTSWKCTYDPEVRKSETAAIPDDPADTQGADQDDRSDT